MVMQALLLNFNVNSTSRVKVKQGPGPDVPSNEGGE